MDLLFKRVGMWHIVLLSIFSALLFGFAFSDTVNAQAGTISARWKDANTITVTNSSTGNSVDHVFSSTTTSLPPLPGSYQVFTSGGLGSSIVYFGERFNLATATSAMYIQNGIDPTSGFSIPLQSPRPGDDPGTGTDPTDPDPVAEGEGSPAETCTVQAIGWIICPLVTFMSEVTDGAYDAAKTFLVFRIENPWSTDPEDNPIYTIWASMRNFANIAFVLAFFAVIFSQATSMGISAYGIRKMLPRIIFAAIMINLSYYICVLAIDITNIIGAGLASLISAIPSGAGAYDPDGLQWQDLAGPILAGGLAIGVVATMAVLATGTLFAFIVFSLMAILTALIIFVVRHALLIMLIILAPLAFAAYILPNTESLFDKWRKAFIALLVMYPLVAVLFAGSQVASMILINSAPTMGDYAWLYQIMGLAVMALPLFGVPWIVKFSGGFIGRVAGMVNNKERGLIDRARKAGESGAAVRRAELGSNIQAGVRKAGQRPANAVAGWGRNADGTAKKGLRNRIARGASGVASAPSRTGFGKAEREERMAATAYRLSTDRAAALSEVDAEGAATTRALELSARAAGVSGAKGAGRIRSAAQAKQKSQHKEEVEQRAAYIRNTENNKDEVALAKYIASLDKDDDVGMEAAAKILASGAHGAGGKKILAQMLRNREFVFKSENGRDKIIFDDDAEYQRASAGQQGTKILTTHTQAAKGLAEAAGDDVSWIMNHPDVGYSLNDVKYVEKMVNDEGFRRGVLDFKVDEAIAPSSSKVLKASGIFADRIKQSVSFTPEVAQAALRDTAGFAAADAPIQRVIQEVAAESRQQFEARLGVAPQAARQAATAQPVNAYSRPVLQSYTTEQITNPAFLNETVVNTVGGQGIADLHEADLARIRQDYNSLATRSPEQDAALNAVMAEQLRRSTASNPPAGSPTPTPPPATQTPPQPPQPRPSAPSPGQAPRRFTTDSRGETTEEGPDGQGGSRG